MSRLVFDQETFLRRTRRLYDAWLTSSIPHDNSLSNVDCILCAVGADDDIMYSKSASLQIWLLGYELTDTIMLFGRAGICILTSKKKNVFLKPIEKCKDQMIPEFRLLMRDRNDKDMQNFEYLTDFIKKCGNGKQLGVFSKDSFSGEFINSWAEALQQENFNKVNVSTAIAYIMCPKEDYEVNLLCKASQASMELYNKYLKDQILNIIDSEKKVKHCKLSKSTEAAASDKKYVRNLDVKKIEMTYPPIIQSGGNYSLKFSAQSDQNYLHFGVIVCSLGARYRSYCSNIARTLLVNPTDAMEKNYNILLKVQEELFRLLRPNVKLCDIYEQTLNYMKKEHSDLLDNLTKCFGFATGIEFRENSLCIAPKCQVVVKKGMVFNLHVGLTDLKNDAATDEESKIYALFIGDTVFVDEKSTLNMTSLKKRIKNIGIFIKNENELDEESMKDLKDMQILGRGRRNAVLNSKLRPDTNKEMKRQRHQNELAVILNERAQKRLVKQDDSKKVEQVQKSIVAYESYRQMPRAAEVKELMLYVDTKYEAVILPIFGRPVPFHISTIKNVSQSVEGDYTYLRINFFHPIAANGHTEDGLYPFPEVTFVKELTYHSSNKPKSDQQRAPSLNLNKTFHLIKEVQKAFKARQTEERDKENLVKQDTLILLNNKVNAKLKDLFIRPNIVTKRMPGTLEIHMNGFRYKSMSGDKVDILFNNIKIAFYQPCDGEMVILLHFRLKHAIMFGKKKHIDVQFYKEVGELITDLGKNQHMHDCDVLKSEEAEQELRRHLKASFQRFCDKAESVSKQKIKFDIPKRELGFPGAPYRSTVILLPTNSNLVNLTEWPPFIISLDDVELAHFERVQFHLRHFDIIFVFKDYTAKVAMINAIPIYVVDHVKDWLNSCDIKYYEGLQSLNWVKIMKTITDDPEGFFLQGGWSFLDSEGDDEQDNVADDSSDDDRPYEPSDTCSEEESDDNYSEHSERSEDGDVEDDDDEELYSDEESGKDWSDLEREAAEDDNTAKLGYKNQNNDKKYKSKKKSYKKRK